VKLNFVAGLLNRFFGEYLRTYAARRSQNLKLFRVPTPTRRTAPIKLNKKEEIADEMLSIDIKTIKSAILRLRHSEANHRSPLSLLEINVRINLLQKVADKTIRPVKNNKK